MKTSARFFAAFVALMLSSCCRPYRPQTSAFVNHAAASGSPAYQTYPGASHGGESGASAFSAKEFPLGADCQDSTPAKLMGNSATQVVLPVVPRCQEGLYSCWSTSTETILDFLGEGLVRQCQQANQAFGCVHCCGPNDILIVDPTCDSPWVPEFEQWGYTYDYRLEAPLNESEVQAQINSGHPFAFSWIRDDAADATVTGSIAPQGIQTVQVSHMLIAIGYGVDVKTGAPAVVYIDPHPFHRTDAGIVPLHEYAGTAPGAYPHSEDYISIRPMIYP